LRICSAAFSALIPPVNREAPSKIEVRAFCIAVEYISKHSDCKDSLKIVAFNYVHNS